MSRPVALAEIVTPSNTLTERIKIHQQHDPKCQLIKKFLNNGQLPNPKSKLFFVKEGLLMCTDRKANFNDRSQILKKLVVPLTLVKEVLGLVHDSITNAHQGFQRTLRRVREQYYWANMFNRVLNYVKTCPSCAGKKGHRGQKLPPLQRVPITNRPFEKIAMDAVGPLPLTSRGMRYILVISDYFTRWPEAYGLTDLKSESVATAFEDFFSIHGVPDRLVTDRGTNFLSTAMLSVYEKLGIRKHTTTAYHPQSDGLVERLNATLINSLSHLMGDNRLVIWWVIGICSCLLHF
ncbi:hypothetical protein JTE90_029148 [Oedothorax gibbosus]|uniref:RNA-directed DNA polymerase n=1 Tax=Oedothorax gibbosus TaxID=931172 RepID=A0AAV6UC84_9ARAC|nr:hypothetical protein JTE90_029148 [Oedothorax gibbosus]